MSPQLIVQTPGTIPNDGLRIPKLDRIPVAGAGDDLSDNGVDVLAGEPKTWRIVVEPENYIRKAWVLVMR